MATYSTVTQFRAYVEHLHGDAGLHALGDEQIERLLERAERDLDGLLGWPAPVAAGPRVDLATLTPFESVALSRATCAQAAFRVLRDETDLVEGFDGIASVGEVTFSRDRPPVMSPQVAVELSGTGGHLLRRSGTLNREPPPAA